MLLVLIAVVCLMDEARLLPCRYVLRCSLCLVNKHRSCVLPSVVIKLSVIGVSVCVMFVRVCVSVCMFLEASDNLSKET